MTDSSIAETPTFADALSPLERAALGLQDELSIREIAAATYPEKDADQKRLTDFLIQAIKAGRLAAYGNADGWTFNEMIPVDGGPAQRSNNPFPVASHHQGTRTVGRIAPPQHIKEAFGFHRLIEQQWNGDNCLVRHVDYLAFLALPDGRGIPAPDWWKAPQGEPAPLPQGEPDRPEQGAAAKRAALAQLLDELDKRAVEQGAGFDRHSLPGTKKEFGQLLEAHFPLFRNIGMHQIDDYLNGKCQFQRGAKPEQRKGAAVWALFPEHDLK
jgi:hypothetical protein